METWMNGGLGVALHILKLRTRHRHVRSLTLRTLYPCILFVEGWVSPRVSPTASPASIARHKISSLPQHVPMTSSPRPCHYAA